MRNLSPVSVDMRETKPGLQTISLTNGSRKLEIQRKQTVKLKDNSPSEMHHSQAFIHAGKTD